MDRDKKWSSILFEIALFYSMLKFCHMIGITYSFLSCPAKILSAWPVSQEKDKETTKLPEKPPDYLPFSLKGIQWSYCFKIESFFWF